MLVSQNTLPLATSFSIILKIPNFVNFFEIPRGAELFFSDIKIVNFAYHSQFYFILLQYYFLFEDGMAIDRGSRERLNTIIDIKELVAKHSE